MTAAQALGDPFLDEYTKQAPIAPAAEDVKSKPSDTVWCHLLATSAYINVFRIHPHMLFSSTMLIHLHRVPLLNDLVYDGIWSLFCSWVSMNVHHSIAYTDVLTPIDGNKTYNAREAILVLISKSHFEVSKLSMQYKLERTVLWNQQLSRQWCSTQYNFNMEIICTDMH